MNKKLLHVGIIMDGNRRWAKANKLAFLNGYKRGVDTIKIAVESSIDLKIPYLTCYAFSKENWNRDEAEIFYLKQLLEEYLDQELHNTKNNIYNTDKRVKFNIIGDYKDFGNAISEKIELLQSLTNNYSDLVFTVAINYGSKQEILATVNSIIADVKNNLITTEITEEKFNTYLFTKDIPNLDLVIRTGGEQRLSNFMLWQAAYAELVFLNIMWPDFSKQDFINSVDVFYNRDRRIGK